ncbi:MAG: thioredoxin domain-containing protein, partial [Planctomycetia bacterium]|nr:thioredoxin domain-containing protein [Planctomycetia bacterium]
LAILTGKNEYREKAEGTLKGVIGATKRAPSQYASLLSSLDFYLGPVKEIALAGKPEDKGMAKLLAVVHGRFLPNKVVAMFDPGAEGAGAIAKAVPLLQYKELIEGRAAAYVCENYACKAPVTSADELAKALAKKGKED